MAEKQFLAPSLRIEREREKNTTSFVHNVPVCLCRCEPLNTRAINTRTRILSMKLKRSKSIAQLTPRQSSPDNSLNVKSSAVRHGPIKFAKFCRESAPESARKRQKYPPRLLPYFFLRTYIRGTRSKILAFCFRLSARSGHCTTHLASLLLHTASQILVLEVLGEAVDELFEQLFVGYLLSSFWLQSGIKELHHGSREIGARRHRVPLTELYPSGAELLCNLLCPFHVTFS